MMGSQPADPESVLLFWTVVAAVAASLSALAAAVYTAITYNLVRIQSDPDVLVYVRHDDDRPSIFVLVVENIGHAVASDVAFTFDRPLPGQAYGIDADSAADASPMNDGPFIEGIPALGPGTERVVNWGQFGGLSKAIGTTPITVTYSYRNGRRKFKRTTRLEIRSFRENDASRKPTIRVVEALEGANRQLATAAAHLGAIADHMQPSGTPEEP